MLLQFALLLAFWLLLSGMFSPLLLGFGCVSAIAVTLLNARIAAMDSRTTIPDWNWSRTPSYILWLSSRILLGNLDVALRIVSPRLPISPTVRRLPLSQSTEIGRVVYANSITLTPGTVTIDLTVGDVEVHALTNASMAEIATGEMDGRVRALEVSEQ